ncbi:DNA repair protein RecN [Daejeonella oryzae]|uniref:DNA repair protein RecN n=1 Tax=Daejeonella oryzae TaxID=1122943 RepID=UPI0003F926A8|nr:DNA repair protein RecN [Daejeonella oryzae]
MLHRLVIRNYTLIDNLDISFSKDLNIMTGETGAGKSIILGALSLILGQRAESKYFFNQQKKCIIEGIFQVNELNLGDFFSENDLDYETETVLRREISADGKSRAFINDTPVNLTVLKQMGEKLIDIHSQHATIEINSEAFQLSVVDIVAGHSDLLKTYQDSYKFHKKTIAKLNDLISEGERSRADQNYFQFQFDELENAKLEAGEQLQLETELNALTHAEEIKRNLLNAIYSINESENSVVAKLSEAVQNLQQAEKYNPKISELYERLKSTLIEIKDINSETESIEQETQFNDLRSSEINERLNIIYTLQKKHRLESVSDLLKLQESLSQKLNSIISVDETIERLKAESKNQFDQLVILASKLTLSRNKVIPLLEKQIQHTLQDVGMPNAVLKIQSNLVHEDQMTNAGRDQIQFLFTANKGQSPLPVQKVASGGELSRLMLSIKSLIARHTALPTIIFDEIDTGISGEVALKVGNIMEQLSENMQVIAITHLPQIASRGKSHYRVYKDEQQDRTLSNITILNEEERTLEIAKMLSGENPGEFAMQNARELLSQ